MRKIRIEAANGVEMTATLNDSKTSEAIWKALPIESKAQRWGDEVYFAIGVTVPEENPQATVPSGTIAYWPPGKAFCIFFGQTPYSPVNVIGQVNGDAGEFDRVKSNEAIRLEAID